MVLLGIARKTSTRRPHNYTFAEKDITLTHRTVTENFGDGPVVRVEASTTENLTALVYYSPTAGGAYNVDTLHRDSDGFYARLPVLQRGGILYYHIKVFEGDREIAMFPPDADQFLRFKGHIPVYILVPHIVFMFATLFFGLLTAFSSVGAARGSDDVATSVRYLFWTVIFAFVGGLPLGYIVAYMAFGQGWAGVPVGWDITDNKTLILFLFWLVTLILARKGLKGEPMAISRKAYMYLTLTSLVITFIAFVIPHSI